MNDPQAANVLREISPARIFARPTAEDLWLGPTLESVLSQLSAPCPTRVLLGPRSSGRSCLLAALAHKTAATATTLRIGGPRRSPADVLAALAHAAGLSPGGQGADVRGALVRVCLRERIARKPRVTIEIDDAERLTVPAWQSLMEVLADVGTDKTELLLSLVHVDDDSSPAANYIRRQQAASIAVISWLKPREVDQYLRWRLDRFGLAGMLTPAASLRIARNSGGCIDSIDLIARTALQLLQDRNRSLLTCAIVQEALDGLRGKPDPEELGEDEGESSNPVREKQRELLLLR